ncbi:hypothetical protein PSPHG_CDS_0045 [Pseudomonas phage Psxphi15]
MSTSSHSFQPEQNWNSIPLDIWSLHVITVDHFVHGVACLDVQITTNLDNLLHSRCTNRFTITEDTARVVVDQTVCNSMTGEHHIVKTFEDHLSDKLVSRCSVQRQDTPARVTEELTCEVLVAQFQQLTQMNSTVHKASYLALFRIAKGLSSIQMATFTPCFSMYVCFA